MNKVQELVVVFMNKSSCQFTASEIYHGIQADRMNITVRSFTKMLNAIPNVENEGNRGYPLIYKLK